MGSAKTLCQMPELSCVGCCVPDDNITPDELMRKARTNTKRHQRFMGGNPSQAALQYYFRQYSDNGFCPYIVVLEGSRLGCAAHPQVNGGFDYRTHVSHCEPGFECNSLKRFNAVSCNKRERIISDLTSRFNTSAELSAYMR